MVGTGRAGVGRGVVGEVAASHHITVVARALVGMAEDGVGFADAHEAGRGVRVGGVVVGVVPLGEGVEGSDGVMLVGLGWGRWRETEGGKGEEGEDNGRGTF